MPGDHLHQAVILFAVNIQNAGVHHGGHADFAIPQNAGVVVGQKIAAEHINAGVQIVDGRGLLAGREGAFDHLFHMVAAVAHHVEIRVAARFGHTEHQIQILALLFHFHGVLHILGGAQRAGDIQIHHSIIGAGIFFFHAAQAVLKHSHFGHRIAAQCFAAGQKYHLGIFLGHQLGQKIAVGVQADIHLQIRPCLAKQPGC